MGVAGGVIGSAICLDLNDSGSPLASNERQAEEAPRADQHVLVQCAQGFLEQLAYASTAAFRLSRENLIRMSRF